MRARYKQAMADAASALTRRDCGYYRYRNPHRGGGDVGASWPPTPGLVESARANNRQGFVIGSAYLREASSLMQTSLLPGAEKIYSGNLATLNDDQRAVGSVPIVGLVLLVIVLVAIVVGSVILVGRTNRQFNMGLVVAAATVLLVIGWIVVATQLGGRQHRGQPNRRHRAVRTAGEGAHPRPAGPDRRDPAADRAWRHHRQRKVVHRPHRRAGRAARSGPPAAADAVAEMDCQPPKAGRGLRGRRLSRRCCPGDRSRSGRFGSAVRRRRSPACATRSSKPATTLRDRVSAAGARLAWSPTGTLVLMVVAAAAAVVGLWPRLKEFL